MFKSESAACGLLNGKQTRLTEATDAPLGLAALILLAASLLFLWFVILAGVSDVTPLKHTYFLQADTDGITGARPVSGVAIPESDYQALIAPRQQQRRRHDGPRGGRGGFRGGGRGRKRW